MTEWNTINAAKIADLRARAEKAEAERDKYQGLVHAEMIADMHYCERHELGFMQGTDSGAPRCPHCECEKAEAEVTRLRASAVVWADDASPFTGEQVKALLDENERLRRLILTNRPDTLDGRDIPP